MVPGVHTSPGLQRVSVEFIHCSVPLFTVVPSLSIQVPTQLVGPHTCSFSFCMAFLFVVHLFFCVSPVSVHLHCGGSIQAPLVHIFPVGHSVLVIQGLQAWFLHT